MFKSIYYYSAGIQHKVIDSDFTQYVNANSSDSSYCNSIIQVYEERDLPVGKNLALFFKWYNDEYYNINKHIELCKKQVPYLLKYKDDMEKYLVLL